MNAVGLATRRAPALAVALNLPLARACLAAAVLPAGWAAAATVAGVRRSRRRAANRCLRCGYDLRATSGRCPECGTVPAGPAREAVR